MSTLRTFNLQNPDSGTVNIEMDQGGNTLMTGIATVRGAAHFTSTSGSDAVGIGTDITAYKLDVRVTGAEAGLRVYNPDTSSNASGILRLGNDDNQNAAFLRLNSSNNTSAVGGAGSLVLGHGLSKDLHFSTAGVSRLRITSAGVVKIGSNTLITPSTDADNLVIDTGDVDSGISILSSTTGRIYFGDASNEDTGSIRYVHTDNSMRFETNDEERLRIDSSGHLLHGVIADEDTSGNGGLRFINSGDIQIDGDQKALVFRSTNNTAQLQSAIEWWNENGAGVQTKIACDRTAVSQAPSDLVFYTSSNVDLGGAGSDGAITERLRITSGGHLIIGSGYADFQSGTRGETGTTDPYKLVFQNQYSNGYTDEKLKLYLFNSGNTRQGFGPGPSYDLQYHCSGGTNQSRHSFYTDNVLRMQIHDSYGGVVKPTQPGFYARRTTSGDGRAAGVITEWHIAGTGSYNEGGHFKTSGADQGKFVAPITGKYYFAAQPGYKQTNSDFQYYFRINATPINEPVRVIDGGDDLVSHSAFTGSCIVYMTAGQKFDVYIGHVHHVNTTFNFFCGYLIG